MKKSDKERGAVLWRDEDNPAGVPQTERVLSIDNVARMFGVSRITLRYYEFRRLIRRRHRLEGVRVYGWADCERLALIIKCRKAGILLNDIIAVIKATEDDATPGEFLAGQETCTELVERLEQRRREVDEALSELSHIFAVLNSKFFGESRPDRRD